MACVFYEFRASWSLIKIRQAKFNVMKIKLINLITWLYSIDFRKLHKLWESQKSGRCDSCLLPESRRPTVAAPRSTCSRAVRAEPHKRAFRRRSAMFYPLAFIRFHDRQTAGVQTAPRNTSWNHRVTVWDVSAVAFCERTKYTARTTRTMRSCMERSAKDRNLIISDDSTEGIFASVTENGTPMLTNQQVMPTSEEKNG